MIQHSIIWVRRLYDMFFHSLHDHPFPAPPFFFWLSFSCIVSLSYLLFGNSITQITPVFTYFVNVGRETPSSCNTSFDNTITISFPDIIIIHLNNYFHYFIKIFNMILFFIYFKHYIVPSNLPFALYTAPDNYKNVSKFPSHDTPFLYTLQPHPMYADLP